MNGGLLVVGGDANLSADLIRDAERRGLAAGATSRRQRPKAIDAVSQWHHLDLRNVTPRDMRNLVGYSHAIVAAGISSISQCERHPFATSQVNVEGVWHLCQELSKQGTRITILSSNQVFSRWLRAPNPRSERRPACEYGKQKRDLENLVLELDNCQVVRLSKVFPPKFPLIERWISEAKQGIAIRAFTNVTVSPVTSQYASRQILEAVFTEGSERIHHISASDEVAYFELADICMRYAGITSRIEPIEAANNPKEGIIIGPYARLTLNNGREVAPDTIQTLAAYFHA